MQFEKAVEEDPFGLNQFLTEAKKAKRPSDRLELSLLTLANGYNTLFVYLPVCLSVCLSLCKFTNL